MPPVLPLPTTRFLLAAVLGTWLVFAAAAVRAQAPAEPAQERAAPAAAAPQPSPSPSRSLGAARDSPRAALLHYFEAARAGRWDDAARYLELNEQLRPRGAQLARRLKGVIDGHHWIDLESVSGDSAGRLDDDLQPELEEVDRIRINGREESMRMLRSVDAHGAQWRFSPSTVERIDAWYQVLPDRWLRDAIVYGRLDSLLLRTGPFELLWWQWIAMPLLVIGAWLIGSLLGRGTRLLMTRIAARTASRWDDRVVECIGAPLTLAWSLNLFRLGARGLVLTDPAYRLLDAFATAGMVYALFWALWRSSGVIAEQMLQQPWALRSASARSFVTVGSNFARGAIFGLGGLAVLAAAGYPVGTLLAGLGIGGLAIAFGAQKSIENIFGSLSLVVDQPFRVGDFVRVEDFVGTVEDIGLRSTRFRTLDRTLVSIPNGKLAEQRLESYEVRDRMRLAATFGLDYRSTRQQMQAVLAGFERVLRAHPRLWPGGLTVSFKEFGTSSLDIEVMAWFQVPSWGEFQQCRQDVLLGFMQVVEEAGTRFALPSRTLHFAERPDGLPGAAKA